MSESEREREGGQKIVSERESVRERERERGRDCERDFSK